MTPRERRDIPWIVAAGIIICLIVILAQAWRAM